MTAGGTAGKLADPGGLADRGVRLFDFLTELQRLRTKVVRTLDNYPTLIWYADLPADSRITSPLSASAEDTSVWLAIDRVEREEPPAPPEAVAPWLTREAVHDSTADAPELAQQIRTPVEVISSDGERVTALEDVDLAARPDVQRAYDAWLPRWRVWAVSDRERAAVAVAYQQLYEMFQEARDLAETFEVVLAFGYLTCNSGGVPVRRHLLTARAEVELDLDTGRLTVTASPDGPRVTLEQDMLDPVDTVPLAVRTEIDELRAVADGDPWATDVVPSILRSWINGVSADAEYHSSEVPHQAATATTHVSFAPALILRERNQRSLIAALETIRAAIATTGVVPPGVAQLVQVSDGRAFGEDLEAWESAFADAETFFPKPSNEEQREIVDRLRESRLVVVQGPPGTGKTHTIANLITDLLAHGQRVLITSHTARALKVLKDKLPEEIQDLCVSVTDDATKGQSDLERSVSTILGRWQRRRPGEEAAAAERLISDLAQAREHASEAIAALQDIRNQETLEFTPDVGDYRGTMQTIAARLLDEEPTLGWLPDPADGQPPLNSAHLLDYLAARRAVTDDVRRTAGRVPPAEDVLDAGEFADLAARQAETVSLVAAQAGIRDSAVYRALVHAAPAERTTLRAAAEDARKIVARLQTRPEPWVPAALGDFLLGRDRALVQQHSDTGLALTQAEPHLAVLRSASVTGLDGLELGVALGQGRLLYERLAAGKKLTTLGVPSKAQREAATLVDRVRVDGCKIDTLDSLTPLMAHLTLEQLVRPIEQVWYGGPQAGPIPQRLARLADDNAVLTALLGLRVPLDAMRQTVQSIAGMPALDLVKTDTFDELSAALDAADIDALQVEIITATGPARAALRRAQGKPDSAPCNAAMLAALDAWDVPGFMRASSNLDRVRAANDALAALAASRKRIDQHCPQLASFIDTSPDDTIWDERLRRFVDAWAWSAWDTWIASRTDPASEQQWRTQLANADEDARRALNELAALRGWAECLERMTPEESVQLGIYANAIKKLGKGTGKHAPRWRAEARKAIEQCQTAIPAWIMPLHRVAETVPVDQPNTFDVVIIDEASQSGLEALLLTWLAPRVVIVGDDKQLGPQNIGLDHDAVFTLQQRYLTGLATSGLFGPLTTLFDVAVALAQGGKIMLTEHFRCMPEIIEFSNGLCYDHQLQPLRQYGADRLPPLRTTYVRGAMVEGRGQSIVNQAEAQALVDAVAKCCADPAYSGKTMGVITLLGGHQDKLITQWLISELGVHEIEQRRLRVGNAEALQGDERHVIFMSMVSSLQGMDGPRMIGPLTRTGDEQRFNVAASRAQDQVWLFHSVGPSDLSTKDLRREYLNHLLKPPLDAALVDLGVVERDVRHPKFDSLFEQRVFLDVSERGYRVRPQYRVGRYRIDLVVEGGTRRLAIECDGDEFHGVDQHTDDAVRQRDLERVGWTFWRVRGSQYFRNPAHAMQGLWALLDELGIQPTVEEPVDNVVAETQAEPLPLVEEQPPVPTRAPSVVLPPARRLPAEASLLGVVPAPSEPQTSAPSAAAPASRVRAGKLLLSRVAHGRVVAELEALQATLAEGPAAQTVSVDGAAAAAAAAAHGSLREALTERIEHLRRVLAQSDVDEQRTGGDWVTPGSVVTIRYADGEEDRGIVASPVAGVGVLDGLTAFSPTSPLGQGLIGAGVGDAITYDAPRGEITVTIVQVEG